MAEEILLDVKNLVLHFATHRGPVQAVDGVNFQLDYNKAVVILGESGCGKSSLAKAILRLLPRNVKTYTGEVRVAGKDVMPLNEEEFRQNVRWVAISMVPQAAMNALNPVLRVGDQVSEPAMIHLGMKKEEGIQLALKMFQHVGVPADFITRYPFELSGGMRQRVAIARALAIDPPVLLMDEPFGALDEITRDRLNEELRRVWRELGLTVLFVTHSIHEAAYLGQRVLMMTANPGRVRAIVPVELPADRTLSTRESVPFVALTAELRRLLETC